MGIDELKAQVVSFERTRFCDATGLCLVRPEFKLELSEVGRYDELLKHILEHKWYLNLNQEAEIPLSDAAVSWYDTVYLPVVRIIRAESFLTRFPQATECELYVFIGKHWSELRGDRGALHAGRGSGRPRASAPPAATRAAFPPHPRRSFRLPSAARQIRLIFGFGEQEIKLRRGRQLYDRHPALSLGIRVEARQSPVPQKAAVGFPDNSRNSGSKFLPLISWRPCGR